MAMTRYVALLRGINVGGRNLISMADLRDTFEDGGHGAVCTYIQSGNVLFESDTPKAALEDDIEAMLETRFGVPLVVVVRSHRQLRAVVDQAPGAFGAKPGTYHSDMLFLKAPLTSARAMQTLELRDGVDQAWPGTGVVYFARRSDRRVQSKLNRFASTPAYKLTTIRSWSTTTKLLRLLDD